MVESTLFRAYDIRGIVDEQLSESVVYKIGLALGTFALRAGERTMVTARDGRLSGPRLLQAMQRGLRDSGVDVVDIGEVPTPVLYFATYALGIPSGVMVTGSHNPPNYNGIKMVVAGDAVCGDDIQTLYRMIQTNDVLHGAGSYRECNDIITRYCDRVVQGIQLARPLKIVLDCGSGVTGHVAPQLFRALGCDVIPLFCTVDGTFPHHHPDPSKPENLEDVIAKVKETGADIGLALDGDGDRLGVITNAGEIIWPDRQLIAHARDVLSREPGATIIYDVKCTRFLPEYITRFGGKPLMWKTGHSFMKAKMKETQAALAGEMSGHLFFKERWYGFDDGMYAGARLLEIVSRVAVDTHTFFMDIPNSINTPEMTIAIDDKRKHAFVDEFAEKASLPGATRSTIDGLRADFTDGWGLVRASNTTPCLVVRFEADSHEALTRIKTQFRDNLLALDASLDVPF